MRGSKDSLERRRGLSSWHKQAQGPARNKASQVFKSKSDRTIGLVTLIRNNEDSPLGDDGARLTLDRPRRVSNIDGKLRQYQSQLMDNQSLQSMSEVVAYRQNQSEFKILKNQAYR